MFKVRNKTIQIEFELSGLTLDDYLDTVTPGVAVWSTSCPETADYELEIETDDRKPLCKSGVIKVPGTRTLMITLEGAFDDEIEADKFLHQNFLTYDRGLIRITDHLSDEANPQIYVGEFDRTGLTFPASGGDTATYSYEGSAGDYVDETVTP